MIKRNKKYVYLVYYKFIDGSAEGRSFLSRPREIKCLYDIEQVDKSISKSCNGNKVITLYYQLMNVR